MARLFRVQGHDGRGPYRPGLSKYWSDPEGPICLPWWEELGITLELGLAMVPPGTFSGSAFRSMEDLCRWFTARERQRLGKLGFVIVKFRPDKIIAETPTQVLFSQNYPLSGLPVWQPLSDLEVA